LSCPIGDLGPHTDAVADLVARARAEIPFYSERFADVSSDEHSTLPTSSKQSFAGHGQRPLGRPGERPARYCATSGTTGPRLLVGFSEADWERIRAQLGQRGAMVGVGSEDLVANTHGYGLWIGGPSLDLVARGTGAGLLPLGAGNTEQLLAWFSDLPITVVTATPSFLRYLAEHVRGDGIDVSAWSLRMGLVGGEGASIEMRREVGRVLGDHFVWQELYGASEIGGPTLGWSPPTDPLSGRLLIDTDEFVVELLEPDRDVAVAPGEIGELTITTPYREVDPLIRYRTRDLARSLPAVDDPSGFPSISCIVGRLDDALKIRGALVYPSAIESVIVEHCPDGAEWRIVVDRDPGRLDTLTIVVEHDDPDADGLAEHLHHRVQVRAIVEVAPLGTLPRFEGKAARLTDRR
jgi:phenylacetate-CoA ligase